MADSTSASGILASMIRASPVKPGDSYGAPGIGSSVMISIVTSVALLLLWFGITSAGLVKPLFLPSPQAVVSKFIQVATEGFGGATLLEHTLASM